MKNNSVFIDDAVQAAKVLENRTHKGPIYAVFKFDQNTPDLFSSDGNDWNIRNKYLKPSLENFKLPKDVENDLIKNKLISYLSNIANNGQSVDMKKLSTSIAFDIISKSIFGYDLGSIEGSDSSEGSLLYRSICSLTDAQAASGLYASPNARKVSTEEINAARGTWKTIMGKMLHVAKEKFSSIKDKKGGQQSAILENYSDALFSLSNDSPDDFTEHNILAEISQTFRHGYESIAGTLCWIFYALSTNREVAF